jgi:hypothetical protein
MTKTTSISIVILLSLVAAVTGGCRNSSETSSGTGSVSGRVTERGTGKPVSGIAVRLTAPGGNLAGSSVTGPEGNYQIPGIKAGDYFIDMGSGDTQRKVTVRSGETNNIALETDARSAATDVSPTPAASAAKSPRPSVPAPPKTPPVTKKVEQVIPPNIPGNIADPKTILLAQQVIDAYRSGDTEKYRLLYAELQRINPNAAMMWDLALAAERNDVPTVKKILATLKEKFPQVAGLFEELGRSRQEANESAAVANLRTINTAEVTYLSATGGDYGTMPKLIESGLLDERFNGPVAGYLFSISADKSDYTAVAQPLTIGMTGRYGFYSTPDAVVRYSANPDLAPPGKAGMAVE